MAIAEVPFTALVIGPISFTLSRGHGYVPVEFRSLVQPGKLGNATQTAV
jgi:hypothetical protein